MSRTSDPVVLRVNLADYPATRALRDGRVSSDLVEFDFCGPDVAHKGFKSVVKSDTFDGGELALATILQARDRGLPLVFLPAVLSAGLHHASISYDADHGVLAPKDIEGRRVAVRSYTQTTGVWVRGFLSEDFGVDLDRVTWVCTDGGHLADFRDPPNVEHMPADTDLGAMLVEGSVDAYIIGVEGLPKAGNMQPLIPSPTYAAAAWRARYHASPVNHFFVLNTSIALERPEVVREVYRMLKEARALADEFPRSDYYQFGYEANRAAINLFCKWTREQRIIDGTYSADDLFSDAEPILGSLGD